MGLLSFPLYDFKEIYFELTQKNIILQNAILLAQ